VRSESVADDSPPVPALHMARSWASSSSLRSRRAVRSDSRTRDPPHPARPDHPESSADREDPLDIDRPMTAGTARRTDSDLPSEDDRPNAARRRSSRGQGQALSSFDVKHTQCGHGHDGMSSCTGDPPTGSENPPVPGDVDLQDVRPVQQEVSTRSEVQIGTPAFKNPHVAMRQGAEVLRCRVPRCHRATVPRCRGAAVPPRDPATLPRCHAATLPRCHAATLPRCHAATLPRCHGAPVSSNSRDRGTRFT